MFESWRSFVNFRGETRLHRRYVRSEESEFFLKAVAASCQSRVREIAKGSIFWRAQLDHDWRLNDEIMEEFPAPAGPKRMKPLSDRAQEGRANPKGIPCLYLATSQDAAMSEVRPWIGSLISLAQFQTFRVLRVIDCSVHHDSGPTFYWQKPPVEQTENIVWRDIDRAFAEPVTRSDDVAEYAATQTIAELFRAEGYDGIVYKSPFGAEGYNLAFFDLDSAALINCGLFKALSVKYEFEDQNETYFVNAPKGDPHSDTDDRAV